MSCSPSSRLPPPSIDIDRLATLDFDLSFRDLSDGESIVSIAVDTNEGGVVQTSGARAPQLSPDGRSVKIWLSPPNGTEGPLATGRYLVAIRYTTDHDPPRTDRRSFVARVIDA